MPAPTEHKTVQARILAYAQEIGWIFVSREKADVRRGIVDSKSEIGNPSPNRDLFAIAIRRRMAKDLVAIGEVLPSI